MFSSSSSLLFISTLSLYILLSSARAIPNTNKLITLPLIKRASTPSTLHKRSGNQESYKLYNANKVEYLTKLYIGTPPQEFLVSIDTGSADTWVPSTQCDMSECPYSSFNQEKSSTFKTTNVSFSLEYAQGNIRGEYVKDRMNLLGEKSKLTIDGQTFGLANSAHDIITQDEEYTSNGILGLGFPKLTANSDTVEAYTPFIFNLVKQQLISEPIFCISLNDKEGWKSQLTIGGVDHDQYSGELYYVPVEKNVDKKTNELDYTFWSVQLDTIQLNNSNVKIDQSVMLDTGTTLSYLTKDMVDQIVHSVTQQGELEFDRQSELYIVDCALKSSKQKIDFVFGKKIKLSISIGDLVMDADEDDNKCHFGITHGFDQNDSLVFGDNILRTAFFAFDMEKKQVGMATSNNNNSNKVTVDI